MEKEYLFALMDKKPCNKIAVMGLGGVGCAALNYLIDSGMKGIDFIAADTDGETLSRNKAPYKIDLTSEEITASFVEKHFAGIEIFFLMARMGCGMETSFAPMIARTTKGMGTLTLGIAFLPRISDSLQNLHTAYEDTKNFQGGVDALTLIDCETLQNPVDDWQPVEEARQCIMVITDLLLGTGFINLDFEDIKAILSDAGYVVFGSGIGHGENRAEQAARNAMKSLSRYAAIGGAARILMSITSDHDATLTEMSKAFETLTESVSYDTNIVWGHILSEEAEKSICVKMIVTNSPVLHDYYNGYWDMVCYESIEKLKERLDNGLDVYQKDDNIRNNGKTFFESIIRHGTPEMVKLCLEKGADPNILAPDGERGDALKAAVIAKNYDTLRALIDAGADIHARNKCGEDALTFAWKEKDFKAVRYLLDIGADSVNLLRKIIDKKMERFS